MTLAAVWNLTPEEEAYRLEAESFADSVIRPFAADFENAAAIPRDLIRECGQRGFLGVNVNSAYGGSRVDHLHIGLLHYAIGRACSSVRSVMTVHSMVCEALQRWGSAEQRTAWLPQLARGERLAAFALTESEAGSDAKAIATSAVKHGQTYLLNGLKCWVTGGQMADVFLVFAVYEGKHSAFLVDREAVGLSIVPVRRMLGLGAAMLATLTMADCVVPETHRLGGAGFGIDAIAASALDLGRFLVAWGCVGLASACVQASFSHAQRRIQFGKPLREHQLIGAMLTEMTADVQAASLLCLHAARLRDRDAPEALMETCIAKFVASRNCARIASDTVQIHGAAGCAAGHEAERWYRDAKIMEIIEGSTQVQQMLVARLAYDSMERG